MLQVFERAMKFSFEASHVWQQFGLALACSKQLIRALSVLNETHRLLPTQPHNCLVAARICGRQLHLNPDKLDRVVVSKSIIDEASSLRSLPLRSAGGEARRAAGGSGAEAARSGAEVEASGVVVGEAAEVEARWRAVGRWGKGRGDSLSNLKFYIKKKLVCSTSPYINLWVLKGY